MLELLFVIWLVIGVSCAKVVPDVEEYDYHGIGLGKTVLLNSVLKLGGMSQELG